LGTAAVRGGPSSTGLDDAASSSAPTMCEANDGDLSERRRLDVESSGGSHVLPLQRERALNHRAIAIREPWA
jgi:hypothetical protein